MLMEWYTFFRVFGVNALALYVTFISETPTFSILIISC